jgi:hypothetical protein
MNVTVGEVFMSSWPKKYTPPKVTPNLWEWLKSGGKSKCPKLFGGK